MNIEIFEEIRRSTLSDGSEIEYDRQVAIVVSPAWINNARAHGHDPNKLLRDQLGAPDHSHGFEQQSYKGDPRKILVVYRWLG